MKKKRVYISGKIGKLKESEYRPLFEDAESILISQGFDPVSPLKCNHNHDKTWAAYMIEDLIHLKTCDAIAMLHNYQDSPGAQIELAFARGMGLEVIFFELQIDATSKSL